MQLKGFTCHACTRLRQKLLHASCMAAPHAWWHGRIYDERLQKAMDDDRMGSQDNAAAGGRWSRNPGRSTEWENGLRRWPAKAVGWQGRQALWAANAGLGLTKRQVGSGKHGGWPRFWVQEGLRREKHVKGEENGVTRFQVFNKICKRKKGCSHKNGVKFCPIKRAPIVIWEVVVVSLRESYVRCFVLDGLGELYCNLWEFSFDIVICSWCS